VSGLHDERERAGGVDPAPAALDVNGKHTLEALRPVIAWLRQRTNAVTVEHRDGSTIKIPLWMLQPDAARFALSEQRLLSLDALTGGPRQSKCPETARQSRASVPRSTPRVATFQESEAALEAG
jgi:hypothetical protein